MLKLIILKAFKELDLLRSIFSMKYCSFFLGFRVKISRVMILHNLSFRPFLQCFLATKLKIFEDSNVWKGCKIKCNVNDKNNNKIIPTFMTWFIFSKYRLLKRIAHLIGNFLTRDNICSFGTKKFSLSPSLRAANVRLLRTFDNCVVRNGE